MPRKGGINMIGYIRTQRAEGYRRAWAEDLKKIDPDIGPVDQEEDAMIVLVEIMEQAYRRSGTIYGRGEWLRRVTGYRRRATD